MSQSTGLPKDVRAQLAEVRESLDGIEAELKPVLETPWETLVADLEPAQKAKLSLIVAYAADSLFYMYIKTQGIATEDHPVTEELARIKNYMKKLKDAAGEGEKQQARLKLNKEAASRFITAGLS